MTFRELCTIFGQFISNLFFITGFIVDCLWFILGRRQIARLYRLEMYDDLLITLIKGKDHLGNMP
jgi:hypothetical protein